MNNRINQYTNDIPTHPPHCDTARDTTHDTTRKLVTRYILQDTRRHVEEVISLDGETISGYNIERLEHDAGKPRWRFYKSAYTIERALAIYNSI